MGPVHTACVRSFLRVGHPVRLHCYDCPDDAPEGIELFDAARLMPVDQVVRNRQTGSVSLASNRYRYLLIEAGMGIYSDCDMFCVQPIEPSDYLIGREDKRRVNGAILSYPPSSKLSLLLLNATQDSFTIPPFLRSSKLRRSKVRQALGFPISAEDRPWGVWGPTLLTYAVEALKLNSHVAPVDRFYPIHPLHADLLFEPGLGLKDLITPRTQAVHLWHQVHAAREYPHGSAIWDVVSI
jgi:hypothetical protein